MGSFVIAALRLADLLGDIADIGDALGIELRPIVDRHQNVGAGLRLDRRGDARLDAVAVDGLDLELDAERLLAFLGNLAAQQLIGNRHEIDEFEPMQGRALRKRRRPPRSQNAGQPAARGAQRAGAGKLQKAAATGGLHHCYSLAEFTWTLFATSNHNYNNYSSSVHVPCRSHLSCRRSFPQTNRFLCGLDEPSHRQLALRSNCSVETWATGRPIARDRLRR